MRFVPVKLYTLMRLMVAGAIIIAVAAQCWHVSEQGTFNAANFFSYFTILSNIFLAIVFTVSAVSVFRNKKTSVALEALRGATTVYMVTTGIVYAVLLSRYELGLTLPWVNTILHQIAPLAAALDWLLAPPRLRLAAGIWWSWLAFPVTYVVYTLARGPIAHWYPYPFLDPSREGYGRVAAYCLGIALFMTLLVLLVGWSGNRVRSQR